MLTRIGLAWTPAVLSLVLVACGSKGELVLPKAPTAQSAPQPAAPTAVPAAPAAPAPAKQP